MHFTFAFLVAQHLQGSDGFAPYKCPEDEEHFRLMCHCCHGVVLSAVALDCMRAEVLRKTWKHRCCPGPYLGLLRGKDAAVSEDTGKGHVYGLQIGHVKSRQRRISPSKSSFYRPMVSTSCTRRHVYGAQTGDMKSRSQRDLAQ